MPCKIKIKENLTKQVEELSEDGLSLSLKNANDLATKINQKYKYPVIRFLQSGDYIDREISIPIKLVQEYYNNELRIEAQELIDSEKKRGGYTDEDKGEFYQFNNASVEKPDKELNSKLKEFLDRIGVSYKALDTIKDKDGKVLTAVAKADLLNKILEVVEGRADITTLPEEAAHFFIEMSDPNSPLIKAMMNDITSFPIYQEVKSNPSYREAYGNNEDAYKKEAIGKVLAQHIVNQFKGTITQQDRVRGFWRTLWKKIQDLFKGVSSSEVKQEMSVWEQAASKILNNSVEENELSTPEIMEVSEMFQVSRPTQDDVINNLSSKNISYNKKEKKYYSNGKEVTNRVTNLVKAYYRKLFRNPSDKDSMDERKKGLIIHSVLEYIVNEVDNGRTPIKDDAIRHAFRAWKDDVDFEKDSFSYYDLTDSQFNTLRDNMTSLIRDIKKADPKAKIKTEIIVYDESRNIAGTIDLLVVHEDGAVSIYDYKTINMTAKIEKFGIPMYKELAYNIQLSEYKRILIQKYGISKFKQSRVIPIGVNIKNNLGKTVDGFRDLKMDLLGKTSSFLRLVPVAEEMTDNKGLNKVLQNLFNRRGAIIKEYESRIGSREVAAKLHKVDEAIKRIQIASNISYLLDSINGLVSDFKSRQDITDEKDPKYLTEKDLTYFQDSFKMYETIMPPLVQSLSLYEGSEEYEAIHTKYSRVSANLKWLEAEVVDMTKDRLIEKTGIDITKPGRTPGFFSGLFSQLSEFTHPILEAFRKLLNKAQDAMFMELEGAREEIYKAHTNLESWAKSNGLSTYEAFDKIINPNKKDLITPIKKEFYEELNRRMESGTPEDIQWLASISTFDEAKYEKYKKEQFIRIERDYAGDDREIDKQKSQLEYLFDVTKHATAYTNKNNWGRFLKIVETQENMNEQWKYLLLPQNKALKEYYDMYVKMNSSFMEGMPFGTIHKNFVANIRKDVIRRLVENGDVSTRGIWKTFMQSLEVRQEDDDKGSIIVIDPLTGKSVKRVPLLYTDSINEVLTDKEITKLKETIKKDNPKLIEGTSEFNDVLEKESRKEQYRKGLESKSTDLTSSLLLFATAALNYKHMSEIEDSVKSLRFYADSNDINEELLDETGKAMKNKITGKITEMLGISPDTKTILDKFTNYYVYGIHTQGWDKTFKIGQKIDEEGNIIVEGTTISSAKIVRSMMSYFSLKTLGLNPMLAGQNLIGTTLNMKMKATEGIVFNTKQVHKSVAAFANRDPLFFMSSEFFKIRTQNYTVLEANKNSASKIKKLINMDNFYIMHRKGDNMIDDLILNSMLQNYGLKDGKPVRLSKLPEGSKSMAELSKIENDKYSIEGLSDEGFGNFRRMVARVATGIKGMMSEEDVNLVCTTLVGQMLMQFRNWMPGLIKERGRGLHYDDILDEYNQGRFNVFFQEFMAKGFVPGLTRFTDFMTEDVVTMGLFRSKINMTAAKRYYNKFMQENPDATLTLDEYIELRKAKLKGMAMEMRIYLVFLALLSLMVSGGGDDKEPFYKRTWSTRQLYSLFVRGEREIAFFFNPNTVRDIIRSPLSVFSVVKDLQNFINNTVDESIDLATDRKDTRDKTPQLYYLSKLVPIVNPVATMSEVFTENLNTMKW